MTYEGLPIEGAHIIPNFNGVGTINLEDYNKKELAPPQIEGGIFSHVGVLDLDDVDENDEKWLNTGIREEGNTEDRIQSFENKFEVDGFKTTYIPPIMGTDDEPRDGRGRIIAAKRRGEKKIPVYYYVITDNSETCKVTTGLLENLRHDPSYKANMESVICGCLYLISKNEIQLNEQSVRYYLNRKLKIQKHFAKHNITKIVKSVLARGISNEKLVLVQDRKKWVVWLEKAGILVDNKKVFLMSADNETYPWRAWCEHILTAVNKNDQPVEIIPYSNKHIPSEAKKNILNFKSTLESLLKSSYLMVDKDTPDMISVSVQNSPYVCHRTIPQLIGKHDTFYKGFKMIPIDKF